jgi:hypothetical protein
MPALPNAVLDTDTFTEVDDQFALAHLLPGSHQSRGDLRRAVFNRTHIQTPAKIAPPCES